MARILMAVAGVGLTVLVVGGLIWWVTDRNDDGGEVGVDFEATMDAAADDLDEYFEEVLEAEGFGNEYRSPRNVVFYTDPIETACGESLENNAFFCSGDNSIYMHEPFMLELWEVGPFSPVYVLAHEWGHLVQWDLGILGGGSLSVQVELQADCLAGNYALDLDERDYIDERNLLEAGVTLISVGDPENYPWWAPGAHGTSEQRVEAYTQGYQTDFAGCTVSPFPEPAP